MNTNGISIQALNQLVYNGPQASFGVDARVGVAFGSSPPGGADANAGYFIDRAMDFGHETRGECENSFFGGFTPQAGGSGQDIRIDIGINPAAPSFACPAPCPMPPQPVSNPTHATTSMQGGKATFENDNYTISAGDDNTVTITNKHTGSVYQASGDPHMSVNGAHAFDFHGTTSLELDDGTKVTFGTTDTSNNATLSSKLTITNGDYGAQIKGIDTNTSGDLAIKEFQGQGQQLDAAVDDGVDLQENRAGNDIVTTDQNGVEFKVDQNYINGVDQQLTQGKHSDNVDNFEQLDNPLVYANADAAAWLLRGASGCGGFDAFSIGASSRFSSPFDGFGSSGGFNSFGGGDATGSQSPWWMDPSFFDRKLKDETPPPRVSIRARIADNDARAGGQARASTDIAMSIASMTRGTTDLNLRVWG